MLCDCCNDVYASLLARSLKRKRKFSSAEAFTWLNKWEIKQKYSYNRVIIIAALQCALIYYQAHTSSITVWRRVLKKCTLCKLSHSKPYLNVAVVFRANSSSLLFCISLMTYWVSMVLWLLFPDCRVHCLHLCSVCFMVFHHEVMARVLFLRD